MDSCAPTSREVSKYAKWFFPDGKAYSDLFMERVLAVRDRRSRVDIRFAFLEQNLRFLRAFAFRCACFSFDERVT